MGVATTCLIFFLLRLFPSNRFDELYGSMKDRTFKVGNLIFSGSEVELMIPFIAPDKFDLVEVVSESSPPIKGIWGEIID